MTDTYDLNPPLYDLINEHISCYIEEVNDEQDVVVGWKDLNLSKKYYVILYYIEGFFPKELLVRIHTAIEKYKIPADKIIFINSDLRLKENYDKWFGTTNFQEKIKVLGIDGSYWNYRSVFDGGVVHNRGISKEDYRDIFRDINPVDKRSKIFIHLNRNMHYSRKLLLGRLRRNKKYRDKVYVSEMEYNKSLDGLGYFIKDGGEYGDTHFDWPISISLKKFHDDSYFSIVHNIDYDSIDNRLFVDEKIIKPIYFGQPFLHIGHSGSLEYLRSIGYETFPELFDESYDDLPQDKPKSLSNQTEFFVKEITRVLNFTMDEVHDMYNSVWDKVQHNQETFFYSTKPLENTKVELLKILG